MRGVLAIAGKDLLQLSRDRAALFWVIAFPLVVCALFGSIFAYDGAHGRPIEIALVVEDDSEASRRMAQRLEESPSLKVQLKSVEDAAEAVRKGDLAAYVRFATGYGAGAGILPGDSTKLEVGIDPSRRVTAAMLQGVLMEVIYAEVKNRLVDREIVNAAVMRFVDQLADGEDKQALLAALAPLEQVFAGLDLSRLQGAFDIPPPQMVSVARSLSGKPQSAFDVTFPQSMSWAMIAIVAFFATVIARERDAGTLLRLRLAPLSMSHLLAGKGLAACAASAATAILVLGVGGLGFGLDMGHYVQLTMAILCAAFCASGMVMAFSVLGKSAQAVENGAWTVMLIFTMLGGGMMPLAVMPAWLQAVSHFSPVKWIVYAFEGVFWRGFSVTEMLLPCAIMIGVGLAAYAIGGLVHARAES
jgi:ABC-2 type transport system permease protein